MLPPQSQDHPEEDLGTGEEEKMRRRALQKPPCLLGGREKKALSTQKTRWLNCPLTSLQDWLWGGPGGTQGGKVGTGLVRLLVDAVTTDQSQLLHQPVCTEPSKPGSMCCQTELKVISFGSPLSLPLTLPTLFWSVSHVVATVVDFLNLYSSIPILF